MLNSVKRSIAEAFEKIYQHNLDYNKLNLEVTNKQFEGDFTFVVFPYLRVTKSKPEDVANAIGTYLKEHLYKSAKV